MINKASRFVSFNYNSQYGKFAANPRYQLTEVDRFIVLMYFKWFGVNVCIAANEI